MHPGQAIATAGNTANLADASQPFQEQCPVVTIAVQ
jgi:hypothetical protein